MADKTAHKQRTRARILDEAAQALRLGGTEGISVAALMKRAGLTHGGFYAHFSSRDDLVGHAVQRMFEDSDRMLERTIGDSAGAAGPNAQGLSALIDHYLSPQALRVRDRGCPLPGLSGEATRMPEPARRHFDAGIRKFREAIRNTLSGMGMPDADRLAASVLAEMVGAVTMARSLNDESEALAWLDACRGTIRQRLGLTDRRTP